MYNSFSKTCNLCHAKYNASQEVDRKHDSACLFNAVFMVTVMTDTNLKLFCSVCRTIVVDSQYYSLDFAYLLQYPTFSCCSLAMDIGLTGTLGEPHLGKCLNYDFTCITSGGYTLYTSENVNFQLCFHNNYLL